jgi:mannose-6-phosphate isomerase-like protein (cupin superfamily)
MSSACSFWKAAWRRGWKDKQDRPALLSPGDMIALPACIPHVFRNACGGVLRLLGIHTSPTRIVHRVDE